MSRRLCLLLTALAAVCGSGVLVASAQDRPATADLSAHVRWGRVLSVHQAEWRLSQLPYRFSFREVRQLPKGAKTAVAGRAGGPHHVYLNFGLALGRYAHPVPVPGAGTLGAISFPVAGFTYTDDMLLRARNQHIVGNPRFRSQRQWRTAVRMTVDIEEALCRASTGRPCPV